ncbi:MAG: type II toxin-antitoxin system RelE/ParE family toxin [Candidatus Hydrogenedentes bacterium]|nr:type II toxin-antitoxin system RelE/ParE family toxin [Candidatus Hydrogenedentota bacterium]
MRVQFHPAAEAELENAVDYYESAGQGLGRDFAREVLFAVERVLAYPHAWPILEGDIHRCLVHRFPYGLLYVTSEEAILILAIMHLRRRPGLWKERNR